LRRRLARWAKDNAETLKAADPAMPDGFSNRRADNWRLLFAIADLAGEDWGTKAREAARRLEGASDSTTSKVRALIAIKAIFDEVKSDAIGSQDLIDRLTADSESEWAEWYRGKPITQRQLAVLLKPFHIFPDRVQVGANRVRGYSRAQFEDAWERYIPTATQRAPGVSP
jgi:hypothetical protein